MKKEVKKIQIKSGFESKKDREVLIGTDVKLPNG